ncbi:hypothetical protein NUW58_g7393 [Xylaria curta]|uniref:Uncharacterized protein n=1 Tax=Xylaria curta TaxID=42375 RepID=A0ACC1NJQ2_9PEZI|nr:hypothetical protein NUW58_g7393 [Xylaria curta]
MNLNFIKHSSLISQSNSTLAKASLTNFSSWAVTFRCSSEGASVRTDVDFPHVESPTPSPIVFPRRPSLLLASLSVSGGVGTPRGAPGSASASPPSGTRAGGLRTCPKRSHRPDQTKTVPGDAPFVPLLKTPAPPASRSYPPNTPKNLSRASSRTRATRSQSHPENWNSSADSSPTGPKDARSRGAHSRIYSSSSIPPQIGSSEDKEMMAGLSPPPRRHDAIGQAIG